MRRRRWLGSCGALLLLALLAAAVRHAEGCSNVGVFNPRGSFVMTHTKRRSDELHHKGKVSAGSQKHVFFYPSPAAACGTLPTLSGLDARHGKASRRGLCRGLFFVSVLFLFSAAHALLGVLFIG